MTDNNTPLTREKIVGLLQTARLLTIDNDPGAVAKSREIQYQLFQGLPPGGNSEELGRLFLFAMKNEESIEAMADKIMALYEK